MKKIKYNILLLVFILFNSSILSAQKIVPFDIAFQLKGKSNLEKKDSIQIETCKFYISNIKFYKSNAVLFSNSNFYKLVDFKSDTSVVITTQIPSNIYVDAISFDLGIDSNVNKQGIQGGDLDPTMGMYWSWQSGYINFKLEGNSPKCKTRKNKFQFHIGGFAADQYPLQTVYLNSISSNNSSIAIDLSKFFNSINIEKESSLMIPGKRAVEVSNIVKNMFSTSTK